MRSSRSSEDTWSSLGLPHGGETSREVGDGGVVGEVSSSLLLKTLMVSTASPPPRCMSKVFMRCSSLLWGRVRRRLWLGESSVATGWCRVAGAEVGAVISEAVSAEAVAAMSAAVSVVEGAAAVGAEVGSAVGAGLGAAVGGGVGAAVGAGVGAAVGAGAGVGVASEGGVDAAVGVGVGAAMGVVAGTLPGAGVGPLNVSSNSKFRPGFSITRSGCGGAWAASAASRPVRCCASLHGEARWPGNREA